MEIYVIVHSAVSSRSAEPWFRSFDVVLCLTPDGSMWDVVKEMALRYRFYQVVFIGFLTSW